MGLTMFNYEYYPYGTIRYFIADRCFNDEKLKAFNLFKIKADELVTFDCGLLDMKEIKNQNMVQLKANQQILAIIERPEIEKNYVLDEKREFTFCGYDLVENQTCISAITNCGADWGDIIHYECLNTYGLISSYEEAVASQLALANTYPEEPHAYCEIVEMWRKF